MPVASAVAAARKGCWPLQVIETTWHRCRTL